MTNQSLNAIGLGSTESRRTLAFYSDLLGRLGATRRHAASVVVAHTLPDSEPFLWAINQIAPISLLLPKPNSVQSASGARVVASLPYQRGELSRGLTAEQLAQLALGAVQDDDSPVVLNDIGGYWAPALEQIANELGGRLLGVLEGTENGAIVWEEWYRKVGRIPAVPVMSVARSPLKLPEDHLVGAGIVFSIEYALRLETQVLQTRTACVIGFGRIGRAIADALRSRGVATGVFDIDPIARAEAAVRGFPVFAQLSDAISFGSLVVSATGHKALDRDAFYSMRSGTVLASVTSRDTEFDETWLKNAYDKEKLNQDSMIWRYDESGSDKYLWIVNDGHAPNFVHGAVLGPALHLISGEKIAALHALVNGNVSQEGVTPGRPLIELDRELRARVAETWNDHYIANR